MPENREVSAARKLTPTLPKGGGTTPTVFSSLIDGFFPNYLYINSLISYTEFLSCKTALKLTLLLKYLG